MRTVPTLVLLTGLTLGVSACGGGDGPSDAGVSTSATATSPAPTTTEPPTDEPTGKPAADTVTGTVSQGVEPGCTLLEVGGETLLLVGADGASTPEGARVTVTGTRSPGMVSTCQQGTPFEVTSIEPAA